MPKYKNVVFFLYFSILLSAGTFSQVYWLEQSSPTQKNLTKTLFVDSLYGWVIGDSGTVLNTTNGGMNWSTQPSGVHSSELQDLTFISRTTGWILSFDSTYKSFYIKTTNSGLSWVKTYYPDTTTILKTIFFTNASTGFVSGFLGNIYRTTNGGTNWENCYIDTTSCLYLFPKNDIYFINSQTGYACGGVLDLQGIFLKTTNAGNSWFSMCVAAEPLNKIMYLGNNRLALMGGDYDLGSILAVSSNGGSNWAYEQTGCFGNATGFSFRTPAEVWAALSFSGKFAVNLDSMKPGTTWQCFETPGNVAVNDVVFLSSARGYAFGERGKIFKYNESVIGLQNNNNTLPTQSTLYQNYPNPFNPETVIEYFISAPSAVGLKIFDASGKEVRSFDEGFRPAGKYSLSLNLSELPSGVYFYSLNTDRRILSRKMVLIK
jgi:photosystem II stability/assembly factor-like uncharacterized protein